MGIPQQNWESTMRVRSSLAIALFAGACAYNASGVVNTPEPTPAADEFRRTERKHWPTKDELGWQRIPWVAVLKEGKLDGIASLKEALRQAREEKRPILIWSPDGDPFDQC
jgi:hypothetical protein